MKFDTCITNVDTAAFGTLKLNRLTVGAISAIIKKIPDIENTDPKEVVIASLPHLIDGNNDFTADEITDDELEKIAFAYLDARPVIHDKNGEPVYSVVIEDGETNVNCMGRAIIDEILCFNRRMKSLAEKSGIGKEYKRINDMLQQNSSIEALTGFNTASQSLRSALSDIERFKNITSPAFEMFKKIEEQNALYQRVVNPLGANNIYNHEDKPQISRRDFEIPIIKNPIIETNEHLEELKVNMDKFTAGLTEHIQNTSVAMQDVALQIEKGSNSSSAMSKWGLAIAILSLIVSCSKEIKDTFLKPDKKPIPTVQTLTPVPTKDNKK